MAVVGSRITVDVRSAGKLNPLAGVTVAVSPDVYLTPDTSQGSVASVTSNGMGEVVCYALPGTYSFTPDVAADAVDIPDQTVTDTLGGGVEATDLATLTALINGTINALALKAPLASPALTGAPTIGGEAIISSPSGVSGVNPLTGMVHITAHGAACDGVTDDTTAVASAATVALAARVPLHIDGPTVISDTITLIPPSGTTHSLDIRGPALPSLIEWAGAAGGVLFSVKGWKHGTANNITVYSAVGCIAWDLCGDSTYHSSSQVSWYDCYVHTDQDVALVGWRIGHTDTTGVDFSLYSWNNCNFDGTSHAGQIAWLDEGGNSLHHTWNGGIVQKAEWIYTNKASAGAAGDGNSAKFFNGIGSSQNLGDFQFATRGIYRINGGRFELGTGRHIDIQVSGSRAGCHIKETGVQVSGLQPSDGIGWNLDGGSTYSLDTASIIPPSVAGTGDLTSGSNSVTGVTGSFTVGQVLSSGASAIPDNTTITAVGVGTLTLSANATASVSGDTLTAATDYAATLFTLGGVSGQRAHLRLDDVMIQAADPFYTISGAASWAVDLSMVRRIDPARRTVSRYKDASLRNTGDTSDLLELMSNDGAGGKVCWLGLGAGTSATSSSSRTRVGYNGAASATDLQDTSSTRPVRLVANGNAGVQATSTGNALLGLASRSRSATDGYAHIPTMAGSPTGTPTSVTGMAPMVYDTTNSKLWVWNGSAWKGVVLS